MTPGTAGALEIAMATLCDHGKTIILPKPGFTLFNCLANSLEIKQKFYTLLVGTKSDLVKLSFDSFVIFTARERVGGRLKGSGEAD